MTLTAVPGIRVGHAEVQGGKSGCTVVLGPFRGAVEVPGMATGSRELGVLSPYHLVDRINALLLTGGSAFGLSAADGVMEWLAERGEGFDTGVARVPLVPAAVIFDLVPGVGRPGPAEGRRACEGASTGPVPEGSVGAGAGATVGKLLGMGGASPGGVGSASRRWAADGSGAGAVGALAVVNALGDVVREDGRILAGRVLGAKGGGETAGVRARGRPGTESRNLSGGGVGAGPGTSTTLAVVATDLPLSRVELGRLARIAATALPRAISPVNTPFDGDVLFAISTNADEAVVHPRDLMGVGILARDLLEESIRRAVSPDRRGVPGRPDAE